MKLSPDAVDNILHVIATFDRERGVPHDYHDLEVVLLNTRFTVAATGELIVSSETIAELAVSSNALRVDGPLDDKHEAREMLLQAARTWLDE